MDTLPSRALHADARAIFDAAVAAAQPHTCVHNALHLDGTVLTVGDWRCDLQQVSRLVVLGAGKATPAMAAAVEEIIGEHIDAGIINTKDGHTVPLTRIKTVECSHPVPDERGITGTYQQLQLLEGLDERALVICLFSGGGSALLPAPAEGIRMEDKQETTRLLLGCGATIGEINAIRKHLSAIKGGQLSERAQPARVVSLMMSDVVGDALDTIASGPTYPDASRFADCLELIDRYQLRPSLPPAVRTRLEAGAQGTIAETPKADAPCFSRVHNAVIGNNTLAIDAALQQAQALGYSTLVLSSRLQGEAREIGPALAAIAQEIRTHGRPLAPPACILAGGETTVTLRGTGRGGRNQELALAAAIALEDWPDMVLLSGGTDGTDGPTDAAGAIADGSSLRRASQLGLSARSSLSDNDSYAFFSPLQDLIMTGATGTNVMDLQVALIR